MADFAPMGWSAFPASPQTLAQTGLGSVIASREGIVPGRADEASRSWLLDA
ncbi:MAG: hypothetical protein JRF30_00050 [Deltaproteobacteria bacterium]|nr:hypothetical protein [Deltaproteobacteria bacterium]